MKKRTDAIAKILREPYLRTLVFDKESGTYTAEIQEFPGCISQGDNPQQAYARLELAAQSWIESALELGQKIPSTFYTVGYGGKVALRLPRSMHRQAIIAADREGISLNQYIVASIAEKLGASNLYEKMATRLSEQIKDMIEDSSLSLKRILVSQKIETTNHKVASIKGLKEPFGMEVANNASN